MIRRFLYLLILAALPLTAGERDSELLLAEAQSAFTTANEAALSEPTRAGKLYAEAARKFDFLTRQSGIRNGDLYLNLGNTCFLAGDMGQAILAYRRAEFFLPHDPELRAGLAHLRQQRIDSFPEESNAGWWRALCFWHYHLSHSSRAILFAFAYLGLFAAAAWFLLSSRTPSRSTSEIPRYLLIGCGIATVLLGISLLLHLPKNQGQDAVITASESTLRKGDSYIYEPAFTNPLHAGTELTVIEERGDWALAQLPGNQRAWIERIDLEFIE